MTVDRIGEAAGVVWNKLYAKGPKGVSLTELKKLQGFTSEEIVAGLGWLAREGKLSLQASGRRIVVQLIEQEMCASV